MNVTTRRALLAGGGLVAAGTVAAVAFLRKPEAPPVHTLLPSAVPGTPPIKIGTIADLKRTDPPAIR
ncbi:MAG: hypothetical protein NTY94_11575 [Alphaproteobacteria bacterium]|nr:hypothetical protein [Alphaproteobacteria bacterium]